MKDREFHLSRLDDILKNKASFIQASNLLAPCLVQARQSGRKADAVPIRKAIEESQRQAQALGKQATEYVEKYDLQGVW